VLESFYGIVRDVKAAGGRLVISDMFRPHAMQADLFRRKPHLAARPGKSYHEAGLAFDFDVSAIGISRAAFHAIVLARGWRPIQKESWHIEHSYTSLGYKTLSAAIAAVGNAA
jgi:D-alanyl-D-alanine dipeptidase